MEGAAGSRGVAQGREDEGRCGAAVRDAVGPGGAGDETAVAGAEACAARAAWVAARRAPLDETERREPSGARAGCESSSTGPSAAAPGRVHRRRAWPRHRPGRFPIRAPASRRGAPGRGAAGSGRWRCGGRSGCRRSGDRGARTWRASFPRARRSRRVYASTAGQRRRSASRRPGGSPSHAADDAARARTRPGPRARWRTTRPPAKPRRRAGGA